MHNTHVCKIVKFVQILVLHAYYILLIKVKKIKENITQVVYTLFIIFRLTFVLANYNASDIPRCKIYFICRNLTSNNIAYTKEFFIK